MKDFQNPPEVEGEVKTCKSPRKEKTDDGSLKKW